MIGLLAIFAPLLALIAYIGMGVANIRAQRQVLSGCAWHLVPILTGFILAAGVFLLLADLFNAMVAWSPP